MLLFVQADQQARTETLVPSKGAEEVSSSILVVDDEPDVLEVTAELLRILGFEVFSANSGEAALDALRVMPGIEVLLTDVVMPRTNGLTLANRAKELIPDLRVILMSGYSLPNVHAAILDSNEFSFLAKPFKVSDLARVLRM